MVHVSDLVDHPADSEAGTTAASGLTRLDELTGGFRTGRLWVLTGAPGQGCTTLLTQWAGHLAVQHRWLTVLQSPREDPSFVAARLVASVGRLPLNHLRSGFLGGSDDGRVRSTQEQLRGADLQVFGPGACIPAWDATTARPRALLIDDLDLTAAGETPGRLRAAADDGAFVVVVIPRHKMVTAPEVDADLEPRWARAADLVLELRSLGRSGAGRPLEPGEARLTVLKHRRGPLFEVPLQNACWRAQFTDTRPVGPDGDRRL